MGSSQVELYNAYSNLCLEDKSWATGNGSAVDQWQCNGGANQKWYVGDGIVQNVYNGLVLEVKGRSKSDGAVVDQWSCNSCGSWQTWNIN